MKSRVITCLLYVGLLHIVQCHVHAQSGTGASLFTAQRVASAFGYNGQLQITDNSGSTQGQVNGQLFWSKEYTANDNSFVPAVITLAAGNSILSDQLRSNLSAMASQLSGGSAATNGPPLCEPIQFADGSKGYAFVPGFGAGGSGYCVLITSANGKYDLAVKLDFPGNGDEIKETELNKEYFAHVMDQSKPWDFLRNAVQNLDPLAAREYANLQSKPEVKPGSISTSGAAGPLAMQSPTSVKTPEPLPSQVATTPQPAISPSLALPADTSHWVLLTLLAAVAIIVIGYFVLRRQKPR